MALYDLQTRRLRALLAQERRGSESRIALAAGQHGGEFFYVPRQILVSGSISGRARAMLDRRLRARGAKPVPSEDERLLTTTYLLPAAVSIPALVTELRAEFGPGIGPNHVLFGEPAYSGSPADAQHGADRAVAKSDGSAGKGTTVAILDTGIAADYKRWFPQLYPATTIVASAGTGDRPDVFAPKRALDWEAGHGTFIAGVVAEQAPAATIIVRRVLDSDGVGIESEIAATLVQVAAGANVVNLSLGGYTQDNEPPVALLDALRAVPRTTVLVAAAGNAGIQRPFWPAAFKHVVAVGGIDANGKPAPFTNFGFWVDACTLAVDVVSTFLGVRMPVEADPSIGVQDFRRHAACWSGTSFAAPRFAGAVLATMTKRGIDAVTAADRLLASGPRVAGLGCQFDPNAV